MGNSEAKHHRTTQSNFLIPRIVRIDLNFRKKWRRFRLLFTVGVARTGAQG